jgi:hypothetical protein
MSLPANFGQNPTEEPHRFFRNVCIQFRKAILSSKNYQMLESEIENFINASKEMNWHVKNSDVYHKDQGEKAVQKVLSECDRYYKSLITDPSSAVAQDLIEALAEVERLVDNFKAT